MLDRKLIRKDPERVREGLRKKGVAFDLDAFLALDERQRALIQETESLKHERNDVSQEISRLKKEGADASAILERMKKTSERIKEIDAELKATGERLDDLALYIPNLAHDSVPYGTCPEHNVVRRQWGKTPETSPETLPHWEIGERLGILDLATGSALSGRGFVVLRGSGALLSRALVAFMLDLHRTQGYEEIAVPYLVSRQCMIGTGQLPKLAEDMYASE
jgi:seryl-tRNA synthetase